MRKQSLKFAIYLSIVIAIGCNLSQIILYHFALRMPVNVLNYFQNNKKKRMFPLQSLHYSQMLLLTFIIEIVHTHMCSFLLNTRKGVTENNKDWEGVRWSYIQREWWGEREWRGDWEKDRAKKRNNNCTKKNSVIISDQKIKVELKRSTGSDQVFDSGLLLVIFKRICFLGES